MITIKADLKLQQVKLLKNAAQQKPSRLRNEINRAINDTAKKAQGYVAKQIIGVKGLNTTASAVKRVQDLKRSKVKDLGAVVIVRVRKRIPLKDFGARQNKTGVAYKIKKSDGTKLIPGGFKVKTYGNNVYKRPTKQRPTGRRKRGPSVGGFFKGENIKPDVQVFVRKQLKQEINRRIRFLKLKQAGTI